METLALVIWVIGFPPCYALEKYLRGKKGSDGDKFAAIAWLIGAFLLFLNVLIKL
jgi:hypothetical protein